MVTQEDLLQILVKHDVLTSTNLKENFNLKVTRDCYVGVVARLDMAIKEIYNLGIETCAENAEIDMQELEPEINTRSITRLKLK